MVGVPLDRPNFKENSSRHRELLFRAKVQSKLFQAQGGCIKNNFSQRSAKHSFNEGMSQSGYLSGYGGGLAKSRRGLFHGSKRCLSGFGVHATMLRIDPCASAASSRRQLCRCAQPGGSMLLCQKLLLGAVAPLPRPGLPAWRWSQSHRRCGGRTAR